MTKKLTFPRKKIYQANNAITRHTYIAILRLIDNSNFNANCALNKVLDTKCYYVLNLSQNEFQI